MQTRTTILILTSFFIFPFYWSQSKVSIKVKVLDLVSQPAYFGYYLGEKQYVKDTVTVDAKGNISLEYTELLEQGIYFLAFPQKEMAYFDFIVGSKQQFSFQGKLSDFTKSAIFKDSEDNTLFYDYLKKLKQLKLKGDALAVLQKQSEKTGNKDSLKLIEKQQEQLDLDFNKFRDNYFVKYPNAFITKILGYQYRPAVPVAITDPTERFNYYKLHLFDHVDWNFAPIVRTPSYANLLVEYIDNLTVQYPDSIIVSCDILLSKVKGNNELFKFTLIDLVNKFARSKTICFDAVYVHLVEEYYNKGFGFWLNPSVAADKAQLDKIRNAAGRLKPVLCGSSTYNFSLADLNQKRVELKDITAPYTLVLFWSWECGDCKNTIKELNVQRELLEKKGVKVVAICTDIVSDDWKKTVERHSFSWATNLTVTTEAEKEEIAQQYNLYSAPFMYLLDEQKHIKYKRFDSSQLKDIFNSLPDKQ